MSTTSHEHNWCKSTTAWHMAHEHNLPTVALITTSHHLQKSLDAGKESYLVQFDFSAAFDIVSHSGVLFKLKFIGVGGSVLSIYTASPTAGRDSWLMVLRVSGSK